MPTQRLLTKNKTKQKNPGTILFPKNNANKTKRYDSSQSKQKNRHFYPYDYISENSRDICLNQRVLDDGPQLPTCCGLKGAVSGLGSPYLQTIPLQASDMGREAALWFVSLGVHLFQTLELEGKRKPLGQTPVFWHLTVTSPNLD